MVLPLEKSLQIERYYETCFPSNSNHITTPILDQASCRVDDLSRTEYQDRLIIPSVAALFEDSKTSILELETNICVSLNDFLILLICLLNYVLYSLHQKV